MKLRTVIVALLLTLLLSGCGKSYDIVGTWVSPKNDNGGYTYMIFEEDGTHTFGSFRPPTDKYGGSKSRAVYQYTLSGETLEVSDSTFYERRSYNLDGSLMSHRTDPSKGYSTRIEWEEEDILIVWEDDMGFPYKKFDDLPNEPSF